MCYSNVQGVNGPIFTLYFFVFVGSLTKMSLGLATVIQLDWEGEMRKREPGFLTRRGEEKYITFPFYLRLILFTVEKRNLITTKFMFFGPSAK